MRAAAVTALALWFGLLTGLIETALMFGMFTWSGAGALGSLQMNRHAFWMITISNATIFSFFGVCLAIVAIVVPAQWFTRVAACLFSGLSAFAMLQMVKGLTLLSTVLLAAGIGACVARRFDPQAPRFTRLRRLSTPIMILIATSVMGLQFLGEAWNESRSLSSLARPNPNAPNLLLIVLDTVRADALSGYGYTRATTPNLDKLAERGLRFQNARVPGTWTLPSHASMFTGRWPHELSARIDAPLDGTYPTIAEHLAKQGYATAGFVANTFFCNGWFGLGRGFMRYEDMAITPRTILRTSHLGRRLTHSVGTAPNERPTAHFSRKDASTINREFLRWHDEREDANRPYFVFMNYFDAHDPYILAKRDQSPFGQVPSERKDLSMLRDWNLLDGKKLAPKQLQLARDCYDDCLAQLDKDLGSLFEQLQSRDAFKNTWVIITSDHGEQFGEHGYIGHGNSVHRQTVHVPLLVIPPQNQAGARGVCEVPVSLRDLPITLADLAGNAAECPFPGRSLKRFWNQTQESTGEIADDFIFSEIVDHEGPTPPNWSPPKSILAEGYVYIRQCDRSENLYHATEDPDETHDLAALPEHAERLQRMRSMLKSIVGE
jgi:arylsulfatase A-like enzyme